MDEADIFSKAWTDDQLADLRREAVLHFEENAWLGSSPTAFTCDECGLRHSCMFAFDTYNTAGDCLADK